MASLLNRLAKLEQRCLNKHQQRRVVTLISDEGQSLEQLKQDWLLVNESAKTEADIDWIHIVFVGVAE
jgi:hypothetical protein